MRLLPNADNGQILQLHCGVFSNVFYIKTISYFSGRTDYETGIKPASHRLERHTPSCSSGAATPTALKGATPPPKETTPTAASRQSGPKGVALQQQPDHVKISLYHSRHYRPPPPLNKVPIKNLPSALPEDIQYLMC
jgi:hypothetical protein